MDPVAEGDERTASRRPPGRPPVTGTAGASRGTPAAHRPRATPLRGHDRPHPERHGGVHRPGVGRPRPDRPGAGAVEGPHGANGNERRVSPAACQPGRPRGCLPRPGRCMLRPPLRSQMPAATGSHTVPRLNGMRGVTHRTARNCWRRRSQTPRSALTSAQAATHTRKKRRRPGGSARYWAINHTRSLPDSAPPIRMWVRCSVTTGPRRRGANLRSALCQNFCRMASTRADGLCGEKLAAHCAAQTEAGLNEELCHCWMAPQTYQRVLQANQAALAGTSNQGRSRKPPPCG
jgi:hypothetical protein